MCSRAEKREKAAYHDSRRYLKKHPPRLSDPLYGLKSREKWWSAVQKVLKQYPELARQREENMRGGGVGSGRRGRSAEEVVMRYSVGPAEAVEEALRRFPPDQRKRIREIFFGGVQREKSDRTMSRLFLRYVAVYLGFGRKRYDKKSF